MIHKAAIRLAESAITDLQTIRGWHSDQGVPAVGDRIVKGILTRNGRLRDYPETGRIVPEFDRPFVRELIHPPFRIVWRSRLAPGTGPFHRRPLKTLGEDKRAGDRRQAGRLQPTKDDLRTLGDSATSIASRPWSPRDSGFGRLAERLLDAFQQPLDA